MAIFYLETSALAKHYRHEKGSDVADFIFGRKSPKDRLVISFLSIIEFTGLITGYKKVELLPGQNPQALSHALKKTA